MKKTLFVLFMLIQMSHAKEGMWLIEQLQALNLPQAGLEISIEDIYNRDTPCLLDAIVNLGGATAEFVSSEGLLLTNHHVAYGGVQRASVQGVDYLTDGFLARFKAEELPAPGSYARVILEIRDVTTEILASVGKVKDLVERNRLIKYTIKTLEDTIEAEDVDIEVKIASMYNGEQYILYKYKRFDDLRVVYMPPLSIGNYGADIDNWMWPRHTGDFAFLRVYMTPAGKGGEYSPDNIPYQPEKWLKIASTNLRNGDFTFLIGYPGRTNRNRTSAAIKYYLNEIYPRNIIRYENTIRILDEAAIQYPEAAIKVAGMRKGRANYHKKTLGIISGMENADFLAGQIALERELQEFILSKRKFRKKYAQIFTDIQNQFEYISQTLDHDKTLALFDYDAGIIPAAAKKILYTVLEREKPETDRDPEFSETEIKRTASRIKYRYLSFFEPADKELLKHTFMVALSLDSTQRIAGLEFIRNQNLDQYIEELYGRTNMKDPEFVTNMFFMSSEELEALNDPIIQLFQKLYQEDEDRRGREERFKAELGDLRRKYMTVLSAFKGFNVYPNANGTVRLTYGPVAGYSPRDAVYYKPFTTLSGVIAKDTGEPPFDMPIELRKLGEKKIYGQWFDPEMGDVPVAFTHQCDITNGNSGSPVLNGKGELLGIAFDGNYEALLSDWQYNPDIQRAISVDIRYVMFVTEQYAGAEYLLEEMGIK